jgi:predicted MFS family arabinose efflux permease
LIGNRTLKKGKIVENASLGVIISLIGYFVFAAIKNPFGYYSAAIIIGLGNGHMFPAFQTMFINLAPHSQRGTANSSLLISWDVGVGLGILIGGVVSEYFGYNSAFWFSAIVNLIGVAGFIFFARKKYLADKLR